MADDLAIDLALIPANNRKRRGLVNRTLWETLRSSIFQGKKKLCTYLMADQNSMLNKRDELLEAFKHQRKHLLVSLFKPPSKKEPPDTTIK